MRILIVGGTSALAQTLKPVLGEDAEVLTAGRHGCDVRLDLSDAQDKFLVPAGINVVINTAAQFGGDSFEDILRMETVNALGVLKLCQSCVASGVGHMVQVSSIFAGLDETSPFFSAYALSKRHGDELATGFSSRFRLPLTILRPGRLYGVGEARRRHQPFLSAIIERAVEGADILIHGSNDALRNFLHMEDMARIVARVVQRELKGIYTCMNTRDVRYSELAAAAARAFGSKGKIRFVADEADIPDSVFPLDDSLFRLIDYFPRISVELGMEMEAAQRRAAG
ncbi:MAG: NAD-dependent epimerase/dehydratase family protein [Rhodocyclales bacterium]|nr:NAD-dependent epimerase/dehydratase family protein [Rhodocyclales bacterium]